MNLPHPFDPRTQVGIEQALWHHDTHLETMVRHVIETIKPDGFVETGSHMGWTAAWVAHNYPDLPVFTVECDQDFYTRGGENLKRYQNVTHVFDDSRSFLWKMLPTLQQGTTLAWLDAHWTPPPPLKEECRIVSLLDRFVCLIDDFQCWNPMLGGDTFYSRPSLDYTKSGPAGGGDAYHNDLSYTASELGDCRHFRPCYDAKPGNNGVGMFVKGIDYTPPATWRSETWEQFMASRPADAYPLHPSSAARLTASHRWDGYAKSLPGCGVFVEVEP